jgi:hypothetical protein
MPSEEWTVEGVPVTEEELKERVGKFVREIWVEWAQEQPDPKPSWLKPWEELTEPEKEVDRRIGFNLFCAGSQAGREMTLKILKDKKFSFLKIVKMLNMLEGD